MALLALPHCPDQLPPGPPPGAQEPTLAPPGPSVSAPARLQWGWSPALHSPALGPTKVSPPTG